MPFWEWNFAFRESVSEFRELLREYPRNSPTAPRMAFFSGSRKGVFWKKGLFRKVHFLEVRENLENPENSRTVANEGESDHFLGILENLETLEILSVFPEIGVVPRLLSYFYSGINFAVHHMNYKNALTEIILLYVILS